MEIIRCEKNHFYDAEQYSSCPQCAAEAQAGGVSGYGPTEPIEPMQQVGPTVPSSSTEQQGPAYGNVGVTTPVSNAGFTPTDFTPAGGPDTARMQPFAPTETIYPGGVAGFNPVVGWLVCVDGADRGTDYRIRGGNNYLGRDQSMDICILNDIHISGRNAAVIGYDDVERQFFFGPAGGHNTVRVNGKMVINAVTLAPYDELTVGATKLMFVPLCGERFDWNAE